VGTEVPASPRAKASSIEEDAFRSPVRTEPHQKEKPTGEAGPGRGFAYADPV